MPYASETLGGAGLILLIVVRESIINTPLFIFVVVIITSATAKQGKHGIATREKQFNAPLCMCPAC